MEFGRSEQDDKNAMIVGHLKNHINKIHKWLEEYREGTNPEMKRKPQLMSDDVWLDIQEQRYEHLEGLHSILKFMIDYPEREQTI